MNNSMKYRGAKRVYVSPDESITIKEAASRMGITAPTCQAMFHKGIELFSDMLLYREDVKNGVLHGGGRSAITYETSEGDLTLVECAAIHPYKINKCTIRARGMKWGFDHKAIWIEGGAKFKERATELDGPPRGDGTACGPEGNETVKRSFGKAVNRTKTCLRDKGREKCIYYRAKISDRRPTPEECSVAAGDICTNYEGQTIEVHLDSSDRPARHFAHNGAPMEFV